MFPFSRLFFVEAQFEPVSLGNTICCLFPPPTPHPGSAVVEPDAILPDMIHGPSTCAALASLHARNSGQLQLCLQTTDAAANNV